MGESNGNSGMNSKMYSVVNGKWTRRCPEGTEGSVKRINKNEVEVNEIHISGLTNFQLTGMEYKKLDFGTVAEFSMFDEDGDALLSFTTKDQHLLTLCKMLPNIDPSKPMDLILTLDKEKTAKKGKNCYGLLVQQDDEWIKHYYKKGVNGLPDAKEMRDGSLNFSEQEDFLLGVLEEWALGLKDVAIADAPEPPVNDDPNEDTVPF